MRLLKPLLPGDGTAVCDWVVELTPEEPGGQLINLHLDRKVTVL